VTVVFVILFAAVWFGGAWLYKRARRERVLWRRHKRAEKVEVMAEEAATDDPIFAPEAVKAATLKLHCDIIKAWNDRDTDALGELIGKDLLVEWKRRLADFKQKGWHNVSTVLSGPAVDYVGLVNRAGDALDRVCVHVEVELRDVVYDRHQNIITRTEDQDADGRVTQSEYWTLARHNGGWMLVSIEQEAEGSHELSEPIVATPWEDDRLHDEAVTERGVAASVSDEDVRQIADVDFEGDARTAALDMANIDGRFAPDVLEAAARNALAGWTEAIDGDDGALEAIAAPGMAAEMLYPGDPSHRSRLVVRGLKLRELRITAVDAAADPPSMTVEAKIVGRRYIEDRDTTTVLSGSKNQEAHFTERWRLELDGHDDTPWRIAGFESGIGQGHPSAAR
jgi:predicted lipid-binding transport protein (Tim44 family)